MVSASVLITAQVWSCLALTCTVDVDSAATLPNWQMFHHCVLPRFETGAGLFSRDTVYNISAQVHAAGQAPDEVSEAAKRVNFYMHVNIKQNT